MQHFPLTEKLHTDVLEEKYGPISAKVLKHNRKIRKSLLIDSKNIARTYALTFFEKWNSKKIKEIDNNIKKGEPIGKAFRDKGYAIRKNVLDVFILRLPNWLKKEFNTDEISAKARLSEFYAKKSGEKPIIYGIVTEVYSPDFRKPNINSIDKLQVSALTRCLEKQGITKEEIYQRVGEDNNYKDIKDKLKIAKKESTLLITKLKEKIKKEIKSLG